MTFRKFYNAVLSESSNDMEYRELLAAATITLRQHYPFFDDLFRRLTIISVKNFEPDASPEEIQEARDAGFVQIPDINTMAVDGKGNIYINVDFATQKLNYKQVIGVLCHEVSHVALHHMNRTGSMDPKLHNIATDLVINHQLQKDGLELPEEGIIPSANGDYTLPADSTKSGKEETINVEGKLSEEVYIELEKLLKAREDDGEGQGEGEDDPPEGGFPGAPGSGKGEGEGEGRGGLPKPLDKHIRDDEAAKKAEEQGAKPAKMSEGELKREIQEAAIRAKSSGYGASNMLRTITGQQEAKVDWRAVLRKYISQEARKVRQGTLWDRPSRISGAIGTYIPSKIDKPVPSIELIAAVDVSGSIDTQEFNQFYTELQKLARTFKQPVEVLYWDMNVTDAEMIDERGKPGAKSAVKSGIQGGGGTQITSVKHYLDGEKRRPKLVVYLTDGWIESDPDFVQGAKRLFVITPGGSEEILKDFGETVKMLN